VGGCGLLDLVGLLILAFEPAQIGHDGCAGWRREVGWAAGGGPSRPSLLIDGGAV